MYAIGKAIRPIFADLVTEIKVNTISFIASMNSLAHMMHFVVH